jgi:hypothetical protein
MKSSVFSVVFERHRDYKLCGPLLLEFESYRPSGVSLLACVVTRWFCLTFIIEQ